MAEKAVHISKQILKKCNEDKTDIREGIMEYNNTPLTSLGVSPSQILNSRVLRNMPCALNILKPKIQNDIYTKLCHKQNITKNYYDKSARKKTYYYKIGENVTFIDNGIWK